MKMIFRYIRLMLCVLLPWSVAAQDVSKPLWQQADPDAPYYLANRRALVGRGCTVNKLVNEVGVGTWIQNLDNLTDENLDNHTDFPKIVGVGLTVNPVVSVRDMQNHYAAGTQAGFCVVASSGSSVLSLDVIKLMSIQFYCDGVAVSEPIPVEEGQSASGVGLSLISIPGSDDACVNLTAVAPAEFDEVLLVDAGGLNLAVGDVVQLKYAFVGKPQETKLIRSEVAAQFPGSELQAEGWNPVLLGIPFPLLPGEIEKLVNDNPDDYAALTPIITVGYQGGVKLGVRTADGSEAFKAGSEVGFYWMNGAALNLEVGAWIRILLFDRDGNVVQEETISGEVVGLGVASGGQGMSSLVSSVDYSSAEIRFHTVLAVDVGAMGIYYGFVREKPEVIHRCDINPTVNTNLCEAQTSYRLESNPELSVTWTLVHAPEGSQVSVTPGGYVTGLDREGDYVFRATAADGCREEVVLTHGGFSSSEICGNPIYNELDKKEYELSDEIYDSSGSLISITDLQQPEHILDPDFDNYATYVSGLSLANDLRIIGAKLTDEDALMFDGGRPDAEPIRVGFVVEFESTGLDLSLLQFFQIRLYRDGEEVHRSVVDETDVLSVGLAGSNRTQKVRFSIEVDPADDDGNPLRFDEIMLWKSGVLNLTVATLRIYYPFVESQSESCTDPLRCGLLLSAASTGSALNGNETQMASAIQVAGVTDNIGFLIDDDINTAMKVVNTVTAGGGTVIAVKTGRTLDFRHQLALITDDKTYTLGANVGGWLTIETYMRGVATGDKCEDWQVLGLNVIGYGDKRFLLMQPRQMYDEVRITIAGIVGALDFQSFYGLMLRGDIDNDGIPDCQDPESCFTNIEDIVINPLCQGDSITVSGRGTAGTDYRLVMPEQDIDDRFATEQDGTFSRTYELNVTGRYNMLFYDAGGNLVTVAPYVVHPLRTTWKKQPVNTDWNEWTNWTDGSPYCCTDVVIPSDARLYPRLDGEVVVGDEYSCRDLHFASGAAVGGTPKLNYRKAWVETRRSPNRYYLLSAPLKDMYTGDMFVPQTGLPAYFTDLTPDNVPQNRFDPRIYQRLWERTAPGRLMDGSETKLDITETRWSHNFNHLKYSYRPGEGFSLWVDNGARPDTAVFRFRFPKLHTEYNYYNDFDRTMLSIKETDLQRAAAHRFIYETDDPGNIVFEYTRRRAGAETEHRVVYVQALPMELTVSAQQVASEFLVGNPFMSFIDPEALFAGNTHVKAVKLYDGRGYVTLSRDGLSNGETAPADIAPMESFFVVTDTPAAALTLSLTADMLGRASAPRRDRGGLRLTAVTPDGRTASTLVASDGAEGVTALFDSELKPDFALFTVADGQAHDILPAGGRTCIPLGVYAAGEADSVTFRFTADDPRLADRYCLRDNATGMCHDLSGELRFTRVTTGAGRFALVDREALADGRDTAAVCVTAADGLIRVCSNGAGLSRVSLHTAAGRLLCERTCGGAAVADVPAGEGGGVLLLQVSLDDGSRHSFKVVP